MEVKEELKPYSDDKKWFTPTDVSIKDENLEVKWETEEIYEDKAMLFPLSPGLKTEEKILVSVSWISINLKF
ncbi:hypothetical protein C0J52_12545 [Blattella germanica]|nr:hypothetical protein C0J52_12545 [Blattella germanica]